MHLTDQAHLKKNLALQDRSEEIKCNTEEQGEENVREAKRLQDRLRKCNDDLFKFTKDRKEKCWKR